MTKADNRDSAAFRTGKEKPRHHTAPGFFVIGLAAGGYAFE
jgi:hypothetical protein